MIVTPMVMFYIPKRCIMLGDLFQLYCATGGGWGEVYLQGLVGKTTKSWKVHIPEKLCLVCTPDVQLHQTDTTNAVEAQ